MAQQLVCRASLLVVLLGACSDKDSNTSASSSDSSSGSGAEDASASSASTSSDDSTSSSGSSGVGTSSSSGGPSVPEACVAYCDKVITCGDVDYDECVEGGAENIEGMADGPCEEAWHLLIACIAALSCEEIEAGEGCEMEHEAEYLACGD